MQFTGQKAEQPASTACLLARKCNRLARKMAANMRNAICVRTQTSKVSTQDILWVSSLFCDDISGRAYTSDGEGQLYYFNQLQAAF